MSYKILIQNSKHRFFVCSDIYLYIFNTFNLERCYKMFCFKKFEHIFRFTNSIESKHWKLLYSKNIIITNDVPRTFILVIWFKILSNCISSKNATNPRQAINDRFAITNI